MTVTSDIAQASPAAARFGRLYALTRGLFALVGFGVALVVSFPAARDALLFEPIESIAWQPSLPVADRPAAVPQSQASAVAAIDRMAPGLQRTAYSDADFAWPARAVVRDERAALTQFIAKRYRVADEVIVDYVDTAFSAGEAHAIDPLLLLAMVATESGYNPIAESVVGAKGLMQIIGKFHPEKLAPHGGETALLEPTLNIRIGAQILREYQRRLGDLESALQMYAGALDEPSARYAKKVFAERARLRQVLARSRPEA